MSLEEKERVSVIIPVYNSEEYIGRCLDSVINQTYKNIEILAFNDGSKDNSLKILNEYQAKYPNVIKVINQENQGVAKTRNDGIKKATGKYVMFIDNDDYINTNYIETFVKEAEKEDLDIILGGYKRVNSESKTLREVKLENTEWSKLVIMAPWAKIYKKEYIIEKDIQFLDNNIGEDVYFNLQAMFLTDKIKIIDYVGYNWFFNEKSVSNTIQKNLDKINVFNLLDNCYNTLKSKEVLKNNNNIIEMFFLRYIIWFLLFSTKGALKQEIITIYNKLFKWLGDRFPNYKKNKYISLTKPKGESPIIRTLIYTFMILQKIRMDRIFIITWSKIGKNKYRNG